MNRTFKRLASIGAATATATTLVLLSPSIASAANCGAPAGKVCVHVENNTDFVKSIRINGKYGKCLPRGGTTKKDYYDAFVAPYGTPDVLTYAKPDCSGDSKNAAAVTWEDPSGSWRTVSIDPPGGGCTLAANRNRELVC